MAELKAGEWPVSEIDPKVIDPDGLYLPRDPCEVAEEQQDIARGSKDLYQQKFKPPFGAINNSWETDVSPRAEEKDAKGPVSKHAAANRDHSKDGERNQGTEMDITDDYMNKKPKQDMLENMSIDQLEKLLEAEELGEVPETSESLDPEDLLINIPPQQEPVTDEHTYNSAEDDEVAIALDTFEHAHQPPRPREGSIEEILPDVASGPTTNLTEAGGKGELDRFFRDNPGAARKDVKAAWHQYKAWADNLGIEHAWSETFKRKHALAANGRSVGGSSAPAAPQPEEKLSSETLSPEFSDVLGSLAKATTEDLAPNLTADEKYDQLLSKVYAWATLPMEPYEKDASKKTSGSKRHMMVCGSPGVGKTFSVKEAVLAAVKEGIKFKTQYVRGTIGKSSSNVMAFLYRFRQGYLVIFDDCDDFLDSDLGNVMKGVFELDSPTTNTGSVGVRKAAMRNVSELEDQPLEENMVQKYLMKSLMEANYAADDDDEEDDRPERDQILDTGEADDEDDLLPARISFQSRILFISNKKRERIDPAVRSRLSILELYLTAEEIVGRIKKLLPQLLKNEKSVPEDRLTWAKLNALRWLELTIKANGRPIEFPGGRVLQLPFDANSTVLEFRTYIDLVSGWLAQAKKYERQHPGQFLMKMQKLPMEFLRGFLMGELVPTLKDASLGK